MIIGDSTRSAVELMHIERQRATGWFCIALGAIVVFAGFAVAASALFTMNPSSLWSLLAGLAGAAVIRYGWSLRAGAMRARARFLDEP